MNTLLALVRREARDSRAALVTAALASAAVLGAMQVSFKKPYDSADAAALASALLVALWTLYFSADAFAADFASGRMATKALLPIRAWTLWSAKLAFVALAVLAVSAWTVGLAYAIQWGCCGDVAVAQFEVGLLRFVPLGLVLAATASAALLCSLLVDSALAAVLLSLVIVAALGAASFALEPLLRSYDVAWSVADGVKASPVVAALLAATGGLAFVRGQRRLGARRTRVLVTVAVLACVVLCGGVASAAAFYRRFALPEVQLEARDVRFFRASASPDGRFLALEAGLDQPGGDWSPPSIFILDVERGSTECVTRGGTLIVDRYGSSVLPWDDRRVLRVLSVAWLGVPIRPATLRASLGDAGWEFQSEPPPAMHETRLVPAWAEVEYDGAENSTTVRWNERGLETRFRAAGKDSVRPGSGILAAPEPGRVLRATQGRLLLLDMASGEERCVLEGGVSRLSPSPDGAAVMVHTRDATHVLRASDGQPLHSPWPMTKIVRGKNVEYRGGAAWLRDGHDHRIVTVTEPDRPEVRCVLDLESGRTIELAANTRHPNLYRLADRGYVYVDANGDLVWVDLDGSLVKVLVRRRRARRRAQGLAGLRLRNSRARLGKRPARAGVDRESKLREFANSEAA